jgi:type I restriction enzyme R subunit
MKWPLIQSTTRRCHSPLRINTPARRALFDNLDHNEDIAIRVDTAIRDVKKDDWRGMRAKRIEVRNAIKSVLLEDDDLVDAIYKIVENQRDY